MTLRLGLKDVVGIFAIMPTPATPDARDWRASRTVDLDEADRAARALVEDGVAAIMTNGTFGEASTLTWEEHHAFAATVVEAVAGRVPVLLGPTTLNTRDTISRGRAFRDLGAAGFMLGRPMWCAMEDATIVRFYADVAEALPEMGIVVYDNPAAFKGKLTPRAYDALAAIPQVLAAKYTVIGDQFPADLAAARGRIRLMPIEEDWYRAWQVDPENARACWSAAASCGPGPVVALQQSLEAGDAMRSETIAAEIRAACEPLFPDGSFEAFAKYNIAIDKAWMDEAGYLRAGPARPPYHVIPEAYLNGAREAGRRWVALRERYDPEVGTGAGRRVDV
ncbi:hypothetical protein BH23CHL8_BH23CHL8_17160 [soil metagenome]